MKILISAGEPLLQNTLARWGYELISAAEGHEALAQLRRPGAPKLAILDWEMQGLGGLEICKQLRRDQVEPYVYIVLLTSKSQKDDLLEAFEYGADDYLIKPFDGYELRTKLIVAKRILELQDRLVSMREELRAQATHDSLTGLWNRQASMDAFASELKRGQRDAKPVGLIMADIDHFKEINDQYGHLAGDTVLREVASRLLGAVRPYDTLGRYGGEEFLMIFPGCDAAAILKRAEQLRSCIGAEPIQTAEGNIPVTLSMGAISVCSPGLNDARAILGLADEALYRAKGKGRNRVELASAT